MWKSLMARGNPRIPHFRPVRGPLTRSASAGRVQIRMRQPRHARSVHAAPAQCITREYVSLRCCGTTGCRGRETPRRRGNRSGPHLPDGFAEWRTPQIAPGARLRDAGRPGGLLQRRSCVLRDCRKPGFALESRNSAFGWSAEIGAPASQVCQCGAAKTAECLPVPPSAERCDQKRNHATEGGNRPGAAFSINTRKRRPGNKLLVGAQGEDYFAFTPPARRETATRPDVPSPSSIPCTPVVP